MVEILTVDQLINRAWHTKKPVAFLVGSPLSLDAEGGVPGVARMTEIIFEEVRSRKDPRLLDQLEKKCEGKSGTEAYQTALGWLSSNLGQDTVNEVVRKVVLHARKPTAAEEFEDDGDVQDWHIPQGTMELASLICRDPERFAGPILTTNFDPLLSLAIEGAGRRVQQRFIQSDGNMNHEVRPRSGTVELVYLHGYWRDSDTLHTVSQLTSPRNRLRASLEQILKQRTLIVVAYGGWDDVFTRALADVVENDSAKFEIAWCFREDSPEAVVGKYTRLFNQITKAITRSRFHCFGGIDCHTVFSDIEKSAPESVRVTAPATSSMSPLADWQLIDAAYLKGLPPLSKDEVVLFFDGAEPSFRHALSPEIPRRQKVQVVGQRVASSKSLPRCSLHLIRAAGGEGKTTILLQAAAEAAGGNEWQVLHRSKDTTGLPPEEVVNLPSDRRWLLVCDNAENLIRDLSECSRRLSELGRSNVHFLVAARDTDWRDAGGDQEPWRWLTRHQDIVLRGIDQADATAVVGAWRKFGDEGLRQLASVSDTADQVSKFIGAVNRNVGLRDGGSFFGGLLEARFSPEGLRAHVRGFLTKLKSTPIEGSSSTLFDAILFVAAAHAAGIPGLFAFVLAELTDVFQDWVKSRVVNRLGEEAAGTQNAQYVYTRDPRVAAAILAEAELNFSVDLTEVYAQLVRKTVELGRAVRFRDFNSNDRSFAATVHVGPQLQDALPKDLTEHRRIDIAVAAATAAVEAAPERTEYITDLGRTYRYAKRFDDCVRVGREKHETAANNPDYATKYRGYLYEWGIAEGMAGDSQSHWLAGAWLQGLSLSDLARDPDLDDRRTEISTAGIALAMGKLAKPSPDCAFSKAQRAAVFLGNYCNPSPKTQDTFAKCTADADKIGTPRPGDIPEAINWLTTAVRSVGNKLKDEMLLGLSKPKKVEFYHLKMFLLKKKPQTGGVPSR